MVVRAAGSAAARLERWKEPPPAALIVPQHNVHAAALDPAKRGACCAVARLLLATAKGGCVSSGFRPICGLGDTNSARPPASASPPATAAGLGACAAALGGAAATPPAATATSAAAGPLLSRTVPEAVSQVLRVGPKEPGDILMEDRRSDARTGED